MTLSFLFPDNIQVVIWRHTSNAAVCTYEAGNVLLAHWEVWVRLTKEMCGHLLLYLPLVNFCLLHVFVPTCWGQKIVRPRIQTVENTSDSEGKGNFVQVSI